MLNSEYIVQLTLFNPRGGAVLGEQDRMKIYIYDVEFTDIVNSYALLNGEYSTDTSVDVTIGKVSIIQVFDYMSKTEKKEDGSDYFFLYAIDRSWDTTNNVKIESKFVVNNAFSHTRRNQKLVRFCRGVQHFIHSRSIEHRLLWSVCFNARLNLRDVLRRLRDDRPSLR